MHGFSYLFDSFRNDLFQKEGFLAICTLNLTLIGNDKQTAAFRTGLLEWALPGREITVRVILTAKERASLARFSLNKLTAILRAGYADLLKPGLGITTCRKIGTGNEFAKPSIADDELATIFGALAADRLGFTLRDRHFSLGFLDVLCKGAVELVHHFHPLGLSGGDHVEVFLHSGGELQIDDIREVLGHQVIDLDTDLGCHKAFFLAQYLPTRLDCREHRSMSR